MEALDYADLAHENGSLRSCDGKRGFLVAMGPAQLRRGLTTIEMSVAIYPE